MEFESSMLTPQEERIAQGLDDSLFSKEAQELRPRIQRLLKKFRLDRPRMAIERSVLMTRSYKTTEGMPLILRWAHALRYILENISVEIMPEELIVGRCGPAGRYGLLYPEVRCAWLEKTIAVRAEGQNIPYTLTDEEVHLLETEILPYWKGRTLFDRHFELLPEDTKKILYEEDGITPSFIVVESSTERHTLQWILDFDKILNVGTNGIKRKAQERLASLSPYDPANGYDKAAFLNAVIIVCEGIEIFAKRYADLAKNMAEQCDSPERKQELLQIAANCERVPMEPARNFWEAVQSQWLAQAVYRLEHYTAGGQGQGRIDQYFYPFYKKDKEAGILTDNRTLELLECLWLKVAESMTMRQAFASPHKQGNAHYEAATIGGLLEDGRDATNELSYLILESKLNFPLDYPDLSVRIHSRTPEKFLSKVCEVIKEGTGFPKLFNDECIIPYFLERSVPMKDARLYNVSGCTEVRLENRDVYLTGHCQMNMGAILEMTLFNGRVHLKGDKQYGIDTGDPLSFGSYEEFWEAFSKQIRFFIRHVFLQNQIFDSFKYNFMAAPFMSMLHDLCFDQCTDIHRGDQKGSLKLGFWEPTGFATVVDSLAAIKKLVYDDKTVSMERLLEGLRSNFENDPVLRQLCLNAPKYGNDDNYADEIGVQLETFCRQLSHEYRTVMGGSLDVRYVPVTAHVPFGRVVGATPNGRLAAEPLSDGIAPQQGSDVNGPTAVMLSVAHTQATPRHEGAARLFNMKLSPQSVNGPAGTRRLSALIRTWCDLKLWHLQFNIINNTTLLAAQKDPQKYRNLIVRVAGYSAYFVDLSADLQSEIVRRTEHIF